jgi:Holliday junction DNA helicase RuvA
MAMIARLRGTLIDKQPPLLVLDVNGVGYEVEAPMSVFYDLPMTGETVTLLTHQVIKDDSHSLYGFLVETDRGLFRSLLKISGIGAKLALTILSGVSASEFAGLVQDGDVAALTRLPGIGKKTAERLVMEMRDRLGDLASVPSGGLAGGGDGSAKDPAAEASKALQTLGYKPMEVSRMVRAVAEPEMSAEDIIRAALKSMVQR